MDVERQSDDKNLETLILHGCEHAEVIDYLIDHNIGKGWLIQGMWDNNQSPGDLLSEEAKGFNLNPVGHIAKEREKPLIMWPPPWGRHAG